MNIMPDMNEYKVTYIDPPISEVVKVKTIKAPNMQKAVNDFLFWLGHNPRDITKVELL